VIDLRWVRVHVREKEKGTSWMMKALIFLKRRADLSQPEFREWWLDRHRLLAEKLPGLSYHALHVLPTNAPYDVVVEQAFETAEAMNACYDTDAGRAVIADSIAHTSYRLRMAVESYGFRVTAIHK
jgi:uncharacterized protein (TIGR02118 family)